MGAGQELIKSFKHKEMLTHLDALSEASALIEVFKRFELRQEREFITKLRESFFGPTSTSDEENGGSKSKGAFGRNILSELIFACKFKNPKKVSFQKNDVVMT
jgi:hypothetical protein